MKIEKSKKVTWMQPLRVFVERRNSHLYYEFHKDNVHDTKDCRQRKDGIEFLIRRRSLGKLVREGGQNQKSHNSRDKLERDDHNKRQQP